MVTRQEASDWGSYKILKPNMLTSCRPGLAVFVEYQTQTVARVFASDQFPYGILPELEDGSYQTESGV